MARTPRVDLYNGKELSHGWVTSSKLARKYGETDLPDEFDQALVTQKKREKIKVCGGTETQGELAPEDAIKQVLEVSGCDMDEVYRKVRGRGGNSVRVVAAWWMVIGAGLPNVEVARRLDMSNAGVSRAIRRVRSEPIRKPNSDIVEWSNELEQQRENNSDHPVATMIFR